MTEQTISPYQVNEVPRMENVDICGLSGREDSHVCDTTNESPRTVVPTGSLFPESSSASEFYNNLISGVDMVTDDERKWARIMHPDVPPRCGKFKPGELCSFDAQFFGVHGQQAKKMDPQLYKLLEVSWEAWMDSGIDVRSLRDSNRVGVYTGICGSEVHGMYIRKANDIIGYEQTGCVMSMTANRLSFFYSFRGPSKTCDTACSSAAHSLHDAIADISAGRTDYAVVLGSCHILAPNMSLAFNRLHMLSPEGACKAFDAAGNGYVRSEGIAAIVLKRSDLLEVPRWAAVNPYCTVLNCGINNDGFTKEGITFPSKNAQLALEKQVCNMASINPADISYVEAHGTGTVAGDGQELDAINQWYGKAQGRTDPLLIGSVKSNMGHCEGASCLASVIKVCLAMEYGMMPGNLHYHRDTPNPESEGLRTGTLEVVDETQPLKPGLMALSCFGFGGANFHMVLKGESGNRMQLLQSDSSSSGSTAGDVSASDNIVPLAARTADGLTYLAKVVKEAEAADGASFADPLRRYAKSVANDMKLCYRGTLTDGELKSGAQITKQPEIWFAFSGNGSQWPKMGLSLMNSNATFLKAIADCDAVLKPYGVDLLGEFQAEKGFKTPLLNSTGLIAVQIGLVDVLKEDYGILPNGMLGHSAGEIACTYASGCCTKQQAVMIAYHRGRLPTERGINTGLMAATGLSAEQVVERTAGTNVVLACDNSPSSTTVSGPAEDVRAFLKELDAEGIFARALETNGVPYHSPTLEPLLGELDASLKEVIPSPKRRPEGWVTAAFPHDSTDPEADLCSAGYQVYSYRNTVQFTSAAQAVPKDALLVEVGPHSVLRSPLRQSRPDLGYVATMRKGECAIQSLATAVGDLWRKGVAVNWKADPVPSNPAGSEVPRSIREALVSWDRQLYEVPLMSEQPEPGTIYERVYDLGGEDSYICDHTIDGNVFIPMSCFLVTAWEAFAKFEKKSIWEYPVEFSEVTVYQPVRAERTEKVKLGVLFDFSNHFQVLHGDNVVCDGQLKKYSPEDSLHKEHVPLKGAAGTFQPPAEALGMDPKVNDHLLGEHWYSLCERQNLQYGPKFQMVQRYAGDRSWTEIRWDKNWIIHLDGLFQTTDRGGDHHVHVAKGMRRLVICDTMKDVPEGFIERIDFDTYWKLDRGRSVILEGYKDEITTSKHKAARTLVHKLQWLPYNERTEENPERANYIAKLNAIAKQLLSSVKDYSGQLPKIKALFDKVSAKPLKASEIEALAEIEVNKAVKIFKDALAAEDGEEASLFEDTFSGHSELSKALEEDPLFSGFGQKALDVMLGVAIGNQKTSGYTVGEVGVGSGAFTRQALKSFITVPMSALLSYTATDKAASSNITKAITHPALAYKAWDVTKPNAKAPGSFDVLVASNLSTNADHLPTALANIYDGVAEGGFLMLSEMTGPLGALLHGLEGSAWEHQDGRKFGPCTSVAHWKQLLSDAGFAEVSVLRCPRDTSAVFLYRKPLSSIPKAVTLKAPSSTATEKEMDAWLKSYLAALDETDPDVAGGQPGNLWLYGDSETSPGILGFLASARKEYKGDRVRVAARWGKPTDEGEYMKLIEQSRALDLVANIYLDGKRPGFYAPCETDYKYLKEEADCKHGAHLNFNTYGNLKSATWRENKPMPEDGNGLIKCNVAFGALNFRDVMLAYGKLSKQQMAHESGGDNIGFEFSGVVEKTGKRVMGSAKNAMATKVMTRADLCWEIPDKWSLAEAATVPTAYMTAYYSLIIRGRLKKGQRVLIHSGTGAVGLAAIQISLNRGAEVFVTVGTAAKRQFLLDAFPKLRADHIGDSRSTSFEGLVRNVTGGKGVHLVLNSLAGDKLQASVRCLGNWGKLLEIGKYDILNHTNLDMRPMLNNVAFEGIDVDRVMNHPESTELTELNKLVTDGLASGEVKPLPVTVFPRNEVEEAFRFMASGNHIGKVMIDTSATPRVQHTNNCIGNKKAVPQNGQEQVATLPALKLEPALYFRPDRTYIVTGGLGGFGLAVAEFLGWFGAKNIIITSKRGLRNGNQQAALRELHMQNINFKVSTLDVGVPEEAEQLIKLAETMAPVGGIFHLAMYLADKLITNQTGESWNKVMHAKAKGAVNLDKVSRKCKELEHFVMWSSFVASAGNEGQTNYGYANACQDLLAENRSKENLPALSIQWGVIDHVGVADKGIQELMASGLLGASMPQPIDDCLKTLGKLMVAGPKQAPVMSSSWQPLDLLGKSGGGDNKNVLQAVLTVMGLSVQEVNDTDTLSRLGIDSMQLVEVRSKLQGALGRPVALDEASAMSIADIKALQGDDVDTAPADKPAEEAAPEAKSGKASAPIIHPAKIIDLQRDLAVKLAKKPAIIKKENTPVKAAPAKGKSPSRIGSASSLHVPTTPDRKVLAPHAEGRKKADSVTSLSGAGTPVSPPASRSTSPTPDRDLTKPPAPRKGVQEGSSAVVAGLNVDEVESSYNWDETTRRATLTLVYVTYLAFSYTFHFGVSFAGRYGLLATIPFIPALYFLAGLFMTFATVTASSLVMPRIKADTPVKMYSPTFAYWWAVGRAVDLNNLLFMRNFRGTSLLNTYYRLLGAKIADDAVIDTTDIMDFPYLEIGEKAVIGEGSTIMAHKFKDGHITFSKVSIGKEAQILPYSVVTPDTIVKDNGVLFPLAKATEARTKTAAAGLVNAFKNEISGGELSVSQTLIGQVMGLAITQTITAGAAFAGVTTFDKVLAAMGFQLSVTPAAYIVAAMIAATNPLIAIFACAMVPVEAVTYANAVSLLPAVLASFAALPIAFMAYSVALVFAASLFKQFIIGKVQPGVHKRNSSYGVSFWTAERLVEKAYNNVGAIVMGTWACNTLYSMFGADIGAMTVIRKTPAITVPDMLKLDKLVVCGDTSKIVTSMPVDSEKIVTAPVQVGMQGTLGASSVILPGTTVGAQATLAPLAVPAAGSDVKPKGIYIGAPAIAIKAAMRGDVGTDIPLPSYVMSLLMPFAQILIIVALAIISNVPATTAAVLVLKVNPGPFGSLVAAACATVFMSTILSWLTNKLQEALDVSRVGQSFKQWSPAYITGSAFAAITFFCTGFGECFNRGSIQWIKSLRRMGMNVGKAVYLDGEWIGEPGVVNYADGAIADRGSIVFGHLMTHNGDHFNLKFTAVNIGPGAQVAARAAVMPGVNVKANGLVPSGELVMAP